MQCQTDVDGENIMTMWWRNIVGSGEVLSGANAVKAVTTNQEVMLEKVSRPHLPLAFQRTDLHELLDDLITTPLIVVNGRPGSGKTTLVASYAESRNVPCLWYRVSSRCQAWPLWTDPIWQGSPPPPTRQSS